jgi:hypothetical protein
MKIQLKTDFRDYYDHVFYPDGGVIFERMAHDRQMPKQKQFEILRSAGLNVPELFQIGETYLHPPATSLDKIVVYTDEHLHCGLGKHLLAYSDLGSSDLPLQLNFTPWIDSTGSLVEAVSHRYLQIGHLAFWLKYRGSGGWMSNHATNTDISIEDWCDLIPTLGGYPMCAIDFVIPFHKGSPAIFADVLLNGTAVDFNTAPGLRWTGLEDAASPLDIYKLICDWATDYRRVAQSKA